MISRNDFSRGGRLILAATLGATLLASCARITHGQGYLADNELVQAIAPGVDNRDSIMKTLGAPTFESQWDPNTWYYVSRSVQNLAFLPTEPTSQRIITVRFDAAGNVSTVDVEDGLDQVVFLDPADETTPVFGRDTSLFQEIFGNIGRVSSIPSGGGPQQ